jgi:hypothetical protein
LTNWVSQYGLFPQGISSMSCQKKSAITTEQLKALLAVKEQIAWLNLAGAS